MLWFGINACCIDEAAKDQQDKNIPSLQPNNVELQLENRTIEQENVEVGYVTKNFSSMVI